MSIMGLDVGTSGTKAIVFSDQFEVLATAYREYPAYVPRPGWSELNPDEVWQAIRTVIAEAAGASPSPVKTISMSVFGEGFVPVDKAGNHLRNAMTSTDSRARAQTAELEEKVGRMRIFEITGQPMHTSYCLPKFMWIRDNEPEVFRNTWKFLLYGDYVAWRLGVTPTIDYSLLARTLAIDIRTKAWSGEILSAADISPEMFSAPAQAGTPIGQVPDSVAAELGLPTGVTVVAGGHDQPVCALGAGVVSPGISTDTTGTVECMTVVLDKPVLTEPMLAQGLPQYPYVLPDTYCLLAFVYSAGSVLQWYRNNFAAAERAAAEAEGRDVYELLISMVPDRPSAQFLLPHFSGSGTPYLDSDSRGALLGLELGTSAGDVVRAILEGVAYEMRINLEGLRSGGIPVDRLNAIGGGSRSDTWTQLKADITGVDIQAMNVSEAGCLGAAILAGSGAGILPPAAEAAAQLAAPRKNFQPDPARAGVYARGFGIYRRIYEALKPISHDIVRFAEEL